MVLVLWLDSRKSLFKFVYLTNESSLSLRLGSVIKRTKFKDDDAIINQFKYI